MSQTYETLLLEKRERVAIITINRPDKRNALNIKTREEGAALLEELRMPGPDRLRFVADAFRAGMSGAEVHRASRIDPWFLAQIEDLIREEKTVVEQGLPRLDAARLRPADALRHID